MKTNAPMRFDLDCECGGKLLVGEGDAGARLHCQCGRTLEVPPLDELRQRAGLPAPELMPETVVETLLLAGKLPEEHHCVVCATATDGVIRCTTECDRALVVGRWPRWARLLGYLTLGMIGLAVL
jgi:hypothetical protein